MIDGDHKALSRAIERCFVRHTTFVFARPAALPEAAAAPPAAITAPAASWPVATLAAGFGPNKIKLI
jgi:hypothetical protein